ncbi:porphobilinogen deaminase-like [Amphiura filiformis]|uniref:porphobilinogen deaminase-like n=1 Tax=Amphiura filiformis TaxID=82378 RepID=UPI003B225328
MDSKTIKVGSRKSQLAMIQTEAVIAKLKELDPAATFDILTMETIGDQIQNVALSQIGESNLFTKELEVALADGRIDMIVHSLKDLPSTLPPEMAITAVCEREDPHDAMVLHPKHAGNPSATLESLPPGSVIGTSSVRRVAQLKRKYPHLQFQDIRGNLNTRLRKLDEADTYSAIILAVAGLKRMGWGDRISQILTPDISLYAVSQGALAVETKTNNQQLIKFISQLHHPETLLRCVAERALLRALSGGCSAPVGTHSILENNQLSLTGAVLSLDGSQYLTETQTVTLSTPIVLPKESMDQSTSYQMYSSIIAPNISQDALKAAEDLGISVATKLHENGATEILAKAKEENDSKAEKK